MNFYCCVHSPESLNTHIEYANQKLNRFSDKDIPYKFICGTQAINQFTEQDVINAYDGNPLSKYNRRLRNYSSFYHVLNNIETSHFVFNQCTIFFKDIEFVKDNEYDICVDVNTPAPERNAPLPEFMYRFLIAELRNHHSDDYIRKFYNDCFPGFDVFNVKFEKIPIFTCAVNPQNPTIKQIFDDMFSPFLTDDTIKFFNCDIAQWLFGHLYYTKYKDKIRLKKSLNFVSIQRTEEYKFMHYYGK